MRITLFKSKQLVRLAKFFIAAGLLYFLARNAHIDLALLHALYQKPMLFSSAIVVFLLMVILAGCRWWLLNTSQSINLNIFPTIMVTYIGSAFNNVLPGAIGGDIFRGYYVFKREPTQKRKAFLALFVDRLLGFVAVMITICFVAAIHLMQLELEPNVYHLLLSCLAVSGILLLTLVTVFSILRNTSLMAWIKKIVGTKKWLQPIISLLEAISEFRVDLSVITVSIFLSVLLQLLIIVSLMILAKIMNFPYIAFSDYILAAGITQIVNLIPITPGGVGVGEMAFANILLLLNPGIPAAYATIFFAYRLVSAVTYLPGILWYIASSTLVKKRLELQKDQA